ncbi:hypothetical protein AgCh_000819 [Apium graveolens]
MTCFQCGRIGRVRKDCPTKMPRVSGMSRAASNQPPASRTFNITVQDAVRNNDVITGEFDVILGMDWLSSNGEHIDCEKMKTKRLLKKGNEAYLAYVMDTRKEIPNIQDILVVNEFEDVFSKNLLGLPPDREMEFAIELELGTTPVSKAPYRLAPVEMKELASQLQELLANGMIRPNLNYPKRSLLAQLNQPKPLALVLDWGSSVPTGSFLTGKEQKQYRTNELTSSASHNDKTENNDHGEHGYDIKGTMDYVLELDIIFSC